MKSVEITRTGLMEPPNGLAFSGAASFERKGFEPIPTFTIALISLDA